MELSVAKEKNSETKFVFYRYGFAHLASLSDLICTRQATPVFKIKRKYGSGEFTRYWFGRSRRMTNQKTLNMRETKILRMTTS